MEPGHGHVDSMSDLRLQIVDELPLEARAEVEELNVRVAVHASFLR